MINPLQLKYVNVTFITLLLSVILLFTLHIAFLPQSTYDQAAQENIIKEIYSLRDTLDYLPPSKLLSVLNTYDKTMRKSIKVRVLPQNYTHIFETYPLNKLLEYFTQYKTLLTHKYYRNANLWVEFAFNPNQEEIPGFFWLSILSEVLSIGAFGYLLIFILLRQITNNISPKNFPNLQKRNNFLIPRGIQLYRKIDDLIAGKILLLSTLFHDLKAPITRASLKVQLKYDLDSVEHDLKEMNDIVDATINYYKTGNLNTYCNLEGVFERIKTLYLDSVEIKKNIPVRVPGSEFLLFRAFVNLVSNANKYAGGCTIDYELNYSENRLYISIQNHGNSLTESEIKKMFQIHQKNVSTKHKSDGHGLGLSISTKIIELHNGRIDAISNKMGLKFIINLPIRICQNG